MAAFSNQQQPFALDSSFILNDAASDVNFTMPQEQHHLLTPSDISHFIVDSEPHHTGPEPFITCIQSDKTSAFLEEDSIEVISMEKNIKKGRRASPSRSTKDASAIQRKSNKKPKKSNGDEKKVSELPPKGYIHVRARRGEATDSHSLAERVRREKISERMRMLQRLVPCCDKVTGKALMLDQIISYVQSLQNQVEFLSMEVASLINPTLLDFTFDVNTFIAGQENKLDILASQVPTMQLCSSSQPTPSVDAPTAASPATITSCISKAFTFQPVNNDHCNLLSNPYAVLLQGQSTHVFAQDCVSGLYLDMEDSRQKFLSPCDFAATFVPSSY